MKNKNIIFATSAGHVLEYFDATLYGFFAIMLAPIFFPPGDIGSSMIASFGVFAAGFIMRPLGGIIFGHLGDKLGRKKAFLLSIFVVTVPTFGIGCLPSYEVIGLLAPLLLVFFRLLQGISLGGEFGGAAIFIREHVGKNQAGFAGSILVTLGFVGAIMGTFLGSLFTNSAMPTWAWRIPFLLGGVFGIIVYVLRQKLTETHTFEMVKRKGNIKKLPIASVIKNNLKGILRGVGIGVNTTVPFYLAIIYMNSHLKSKFHLSTSEAMTLNTWLMFAWVLLLPFAGKLADRVGKTRLMSMAALSTILVGYPSFYMLLEVQSVSAFFFFQILICLTSIPFVATCSSVLPMLFSPSERYSGSAFSYSFGVAVLGGTAPLIVAYLVNRGLVMGPAYYLVFSGIVGFLAVNKLALLDETSCLKKANRITLESVV